MVYVFYSLNRVSFMTTIFEKSQDLYDTRLKLKSNIQKISVEPSNLVIESAISCHLRPTNHKTAK